MLLNTLLFYSSDFVVALSSFPYCLCVPSYLGLPCSDAATQALQPHSGGGCGLVVVGVIGGIVVGIVTLFASAVKAVSAAARNRQPGGCGGQGRRLDRRKLQIQ